MMTRVGSTMNRQRHGTLWRWLLTLGFIILMPVVLQADSGGWINLPSPGKRTPRNNSGLQISLDTTWVEASGHRPVQIEVTAVPPPKADRNLRISLEPSDWSRTRQGVTFELTVPEKTVKVSREIPVPQSFNWHQMNVRVYEDGRELEDLSGAVGLPSNGSYEWTEAYPAILFIDKDAPPTPQIMSGVAPAATRNSTELPDVLAFSEFLPPYDDYARNLWQTRIGDDGKPKRTSDDVILTTLPRLRTFALRNVDYLPQQQKSYTSIDVFVIDLDDLKTVISKYPESWRAIQQQLLTGSTLIVYGDTALGTMTQELDELTAIEGLAESDWQQPDDDEYGATTNEHFNRETVARNFNNGYLEDEVVDFDWKAVRQSDQPIPEAVFRFRDYGSGKIVGFGVDLSYVTREQMGWMVGAIGHNQWRWYHRHGLSLRRENGGFWNFLVPGVGAAPVKTFIGIITCFMIAVGPINYFVLRRLHRLYLLLITVPLGAALITASLYAYALVKDGLGTRVRLRSYTEQIADDQLISYARHTYYTGLAPSDGLQFPESSIYFPVVYDPTSNQRARRMVEIDDDNNRSYTAGYLRSRVTSQGLVIHREEDDAIEVTKTDGTAPKVKNGLTVEIEYAIVLDKGSAYLSDQIAPGKTGTTKPIALEEVQKMFSQDLADHRPASPTGFAPPRTNTYRNYWNRRVDQGFSNPSFSSGQLEKGIDGAIDAVSPSLMNNQSRDCIVVTRKAHQFVPVGIEGSREVGGMHVLRTRW